MSSTWCAPRVDPFQRAYQSLRVQNPSRFCTSAFGLQILFRCYSLGFYHPTTIFVTHRIVMLYRFDPAAKIDAFFPQYKRCPQSICRHIRLNGSVKWYVLMFLSIVYPSQD